MKDQHNGYLGGLLVNGEFREMDVLRAEIIFIILAIEKEDEKGC